MKELSAGLPLVVIVLFVTGFFYTAANAFLVDDYYHYGIPEIRNGKVVQNNQGAVFPITHWEYHFYKSQHMRKISGYWMCFYSIGIVGLFPGKNKKISMSS